MKCKIMIRNVFHTRINISGESKFSVWNHVVFVPLSDPQKVDQIGEILAEDGVDKDGAVIVEQVLHARGVVAKVELGLASHLEN